MFSSLGAILIEIFAYHICLQKGGKRANEATYFFDNFEFLNHTCTFNIQS